MLMVLVGGCDGGDRPDGGSAANPNAHGRLTAEPRADAAGTARTGLHRIAPPAWQGYLYVPPTYRAARPAPLMLALPGVGGNTDKVLERINPYARRAGAVVVGIGNPPGRSWDVLAGGYGPDVAVIDRALRHVFGRYAIDPRRVGIVGYSDGASYALSLGVKNADLFHYVVAFSPGFADTTDAGGEPRIFVTHGRQDPILPIDETSRRIVPELEDEGYDVTYHEFEGGHQIPTPIPSGVLGWLRSTRGRG